MTFKQLRATMRLTEAGWWESDGTVVTSLHSVRHDIYSWWFADIHFATIPSAAARGKTKHAALDALARIVKGSAKEFGLEEEEA